MASEKWTDEEEQLLRDKYDKWYLKTIAEELGRTETSVRVKAYRLGLASNKDRYGFSNDEVDYIVANFPTESTVKIAENLRCSQNKAYNFATKVLGLKKKKSEVVWSQEEIDFLTENLAMSYENLTKELGKSKQLIKRKIKELNLEKIWPSKWTKEEDQFLKDNISKLPIADIKEKLEKNTTLIRNRCVYLGIEVPDLLHVGWTEEQDDILRKCYGVKTISETAELFGRTYSSIRSRRNKIGLRCRYKDFPENEKLILKLNKKGMYVEDIAKETGFTIKSLLRYGYENDIRLKSSPDHLSSEYKASQYGFEQEVKVSKNMTLYDWFSHWAKSFRMSSVAEVTKFKYYQMYADLCESKVGKMKIKDVRRSDVQEYINEYGKNRSKVTVQTRLQFFRSCLKDAMSDGVITFNPAGNINIVYKEQRLTPMERKEKREEKKWLEVDEYQRFKQYVIMKLQRLLYEGPVYPTKSKKLQPADQFLLMIILVGLKTGMRYSEILGLTRDDILKDTSEINVDKTWGYKKGSDFNKFLPTKNVPSIRKIAVDPEMMIMLDLFTRWQDDHQQETLENTLFIQAGIVLHSTTTNGKLEELLTEINIKPITMHKLRHTQASYLIAKKVPIEVVAKRLGHTDTNMIRKTYGHLLKETEEKGVSMILSLI